ncbi:hypothetical protein QR685DRAFT_543970 [Neurospora intermedia]|uniref:Uncharacterized protein n=1 Tax=Neurospora intermedia TaxID=5142 RepID=A0ABR3DC10_NEUIN
MMGVMEATWLAPTLMTRKMKARAFQARRRKFKYAIHGDYYTTSAEPFTSSPASSVSAPVQASPSFIPSPTPELSSLVPSGTHSTHGRPPNPRHTHPHQHHNNAQYQLKMCQETTETFPCSTPGCTKKSMEDRKYYVDLCEEVLRDPNMRWAEPQRPIKTTKPANYLKVSNRTSKLKPNQTTPQPS